MTNPTPQLEDFETYVEKLNDVVETHGGEPVPHELSEPTDEMELNWLQQDIQTIIMDFQTQFEDGPVPQNSELDEFLQRLQLLGTKILEKHKEQLS